MLRKKSDTRKGRLPVDALTAAPIRAKDAAEATMSRTAATGLNPCDVCAFILICF
jgi:hypothetical protein